VTDSSQPLRPEGPAGPLLDDGLGSDSAAPRASSEAGRATVEALRAIARTARSFLYYDAGNDAIRDALQEVARRMLEALRSGDMVLEVRPTEMLRDGEVVYREPDRERSLAFRLYRDGVRRLTIARTVTWDELVGLLGVLSVRYTGIRQQEDDIVTLLWRQRFEHITSRAVEGFVARDDELDESASPGGPRTARQQSVFKAPYRFDEPAPPYSSFSGIVHRPLTPQQVEMVRADDSPGELAAQCVDLLEELLQPRGAEASPLEAGPLIAQVREIRSFLAGSRQLRRLAQAQTIVLSASEQVADETLRRRLAEELSGDELLAEVVSATLSSSVPTSALVELVTALAGNPVPKLLELLVGRWTSGGREIGLSLLERATEEQLTDVVGSLGRLDPVIAADLLPAVTARAPAVLPELARTLLERGGKDLRLAAVEALDRAPPRPETGRLLASRLDDPAAAVRSSTLRALARLGDERAFDPIVRLAVEREGQLAGSDEAESIGEALAALDPAKAVVTFEAWVKPSGAFAALQSRKEGLWWAAAAGLSQLRDQRCAELLGFMRRKSAGSLRERCIRACVHQRHLGLDGRDG
jgi:hypothetical protein